MEKIVLTPEKISQIYELFDGRISEEIIKQYLEETADIAPVDYTSPATTWDAAENEFFNTEDNCAEERGSFRRMIELSELEDLPATLDNYACFEEDSPEELTLLIRRTAELI